MCIELNYRKKDVRFLRFLRKLNGLREMSIDENGRWEGG